MKGIHPNGVLVHEQSIYRGLREYAPHGYIVSPRWVIVVLAFHDKICVDTCVNLKVIHGRCQQHHSVIEQVSLNMARRGYTLLEVLIATTILLLGLTAVFGVSRTAQKRSVAAADLADAQLACQTALNELLAQQSPIKPVASKTIEGLPDWKMNVTFSPASKPELYTLHVTAQKFTTTPQGDLPAGIMYQLLRWVPQYRVELPKENDLFDGTNIFEDPFQ